MSLFSILVYLASALMIAAYWYVPTRPRLGWSLSLIGNFIYLFPIIVLHRIDLLVLPVVFTALAGVNLWRELRKTSKN